MVRSFWYRFPFVVFLVLLVSWSMVLHGQDKRQSQTYSLSGFVGVDLQVKAQVSLTQGEAFYVRAEGTRKGLIEGLSLSVKGEKLVITGNRDLNAALAVSNLFPLVRIQVTLPEVRSLEVSGGGEILVTSGIRSSGDFVASVDGTGGLSLRHVQSDGAVSLDLEGSGDIGFGKLKAPALNIRVKGNGDVVNEESITLIGNLVCSLDGGGTIQLGETSVGGSLKVESEGTGDISMGSVSSEGEVVIANSSMGTLNFLELRTGANLRLTLKGSGECTFTRLYGRHVGVSMSGSGDFQVKDRGEVDSLEVNYSSSGDVLLNRVLKRRVELRGSGSGDIHFGDCGELIIRNVKGSTEISYTGDPCIRLYHSRGVVLNHR